jgi:hypothetical protein
MVGTAVKKVTFWWWWWEDSELGVWSGVRKGAAKRRQTASALKGKRNSMVLPEKRGVKMALMVPWM